MTAEICPPAPGPQPKGLPPLHLPRLIILLTVVIDAMGIGVIFPVMPGMISNILGGTLSQAAVWGGFLVSAFSAMQFLFGPVIGNLSDAFGRKPVILISLVVMCADYVVTALAGTVWLLLAARLIGGIAAATHSTASAYMADISSPGEKAANFGYIAAAFGLGFVIGPILGGLLGGLDLRAPFWAAAALAGVNMVLVLLLLPESNPPARRRPFHWRRANPFASIRAVGRLPGLKKLLVAFMLYVFSMQVYAVVWAYFGQARFGWDTGLVGVSLAIYGVSLVLVQALIFRPLHRWLGETRTVIFGMIANFGFLATLTVIRSSLATLILTPFSAIGEVAQPALVNIASNAAPDDAQGELQGVLASIQALTAIISPLVLTGIFRVFTAEDSPLWLPGAPFGAAAAMLIPALIIFTLFARRQAT